MTLKLTDTTSRYWSESLPFWLVVAIRLASLFVMISGLFYWADILGVYGVSGLERGEWTAAAVRVLLACSFLIASIGVWQLNFWGAVLWLLSTLTQTVAIALIPDFSPLSLLMTLAHLCALLGLGAGIYWIIHRTRLEHTEA